MLSCEAIYRYEADGVHAEVLDFPSVPTCGASLDEARQQLRGALVDRAETHVVERVPLPLPDPELTDPDADPEEPIHLLLRAPARIAEVPEGESLENGVITPLSS